MKATYKFLKKIDLLVFRFLGFILYPTSKCGKEKRNEDIQAKYEKELKDF